MPDEDVMLEARLADAERERNAAYEKTQKAHILLEATECERNTALANGKAWQERGERAEAERALAAQTMREAQEAVEEECSAALKRAEEAEVQLAGLLTKLDAIEPEDCSACTRVSELFTTELDCVRARVLAAVEVAELDMEYDGARAHTAATAKQGDLDKWRKLAARLRDAKARYRALKGE